MKLVLKNLIKKNWIKQDLKQNGISNIPFERFNFPKSKKNTLEKIYNENFS
jgi:hypothetical protein